MRLTLIILGDEVANRHFPRKWLLGPATIFKGYDIPLYESLKCAKLINSLDLNKLAARLGCLPLALVQAGKYIRETGTSCPKYLNYMKTRGRNY